MTAATSGLALSAEHITKSFDGNVVLRDFSLELAPGTVHALLGHNGSGKSTFIKILSGFHVPDAESGSVVVADTLVRFGDPLSSSRAGLSFVHQTLGLVPPLSVLENLRLGQGYASTLPGKISWAKERARAVATLRAFDVGVEPDTPVRSLTAIEQTQIAIARALTVEHEIRVLVLDEPTAALTEHEVSGLFATIRSVVGRGVAVLYVSHRLDEVERIADAVTVLRDGVTVGRGPVADFDSPNLVRLISGSGPSEPAASSVERSVAASSRRSHNIPPHLRVASLVAPGLAGLDIEAWGGEILGIVGLIGSGVDDLAQFLGGRVRHFRGSVAVTGKDTNPTDLAHMARRGFGIVMGDRVERVMLPLTVGENVAIPLLSRLFRAGVLRVRQVRRRAERIVRDFHILPAVADAPVHSLSGGNQQKVAVARIMQMDPAVLTFEEPFRGVDAQGRLEIAAMLRGAAAEGKAVVVLDSDLDEVTHVCTRILVLRSGRVAAEFTRQPFDKPSLLEACYGVGG